MEQASFGSGMEAKANGAAFQPASDFGDSLSGAGRSAAAGDWPARDKSARAKAAVEDGASCASSTTLRKVWQPGQVSQKGGVLPGRPAWCTLSKVWGMEQAWFGSGMEAKANGAAFQPASDFRERQGCPALEDPQPLAMEEPGILVSDQELSLRDQKFSIEKQKSWSTDQNFGSA